MDDEKNGQVEATVEERSGDGWIRGAVPSSRKQKQATRDTHPASMVSPRPVPRHIRSHTAGWGSPVRTGSSITTHPVARLRESDD